MIKKLLILCIGLAGSLIQSYSFAAQQEFLPPDKAFQVSGELAAEELTIRFVAAPGYYMYNESILVKLKEADQQIFPSKKPVPHEKFDPNFQKIVKTYEGAVEFVFVTKNLAVSNPLIVDVTVQGCAVKGICYPPMTRRIHLQEYQKTIQSIDPNDEAIQGDVPQPKETSWWQASEDLNALNRLLTTTSLPFLLLIFFMLGIGLAFTPCMLPMLPILSSVVFGTVDHHLLPRKKTIVLAIFYILGMATAFSLAGMATAWFGAGITASLQNRWVLLGFGTLMLILSAGLLGVYELQMPHAWQTRVDHWIGKHEGGNIVGVFALGALSSLVASPCVSAPLAGVLTFIAQSGQVQLGGLILFVMACGMGVPLLLFAIGASRVVPRAGKWMVRVQRFFGVLMILLAIWVMLPAIQSFLNDQAKASVKTIQQLPFDVVRTNAELEEKLTQAKQKHLASIVIISADWCVSCKELEIQVLGNENIKSKLLNYARIEVDITAMGPEQKEVLKRYQLFGPPAIVLFDGNGQEQPAKKMVGVVSYQKVLSAL